MIKLHLDKSKILELAVQGKLQEVLSEIASAQAIIMEKLVTLAIPKATIEKKKEMFTELLTRSTEYILEAMECIATFED